MSTICVIGSNSECVAFVLDKPHWILFKVEINEYFNKPHGTPPQPMFLASFVGNRYILI